MRSPDKEFGLVIWQDGREVCEVLHDCKMLAYVNRNRPFWIQIDRARSKKSPGPAYVVVSLHGLSTTSVDIVSDENIPHEIPYPGGGIMIAGWKVGDNVQGRFMLDAIPQSHDALTRKYGMNTVIAKFYLHDTDRTVSSNATLILHLVDESTKK